MGLEVEVVAETNKFDVIVIGGGVAGMTASAVVTQSGLKSCFLERDVPGGKVMHIDTIHNFSQPGINGKELALSIFNQATEDVKTKYIFGDVTGCRFKADKIYLFTADGQSWEAKAIIVATGTVVKHLNIPGEEKFTNHGISNCVLCDATLTKGKKVVLIGQTTHLENLKNFTSDVIVLKPEQVKEFKGDTTLKSVVTTEGTIDCDFAFVENGYITNIKFLPQEVNRNEKNELIVDSNMASNFLGVFGCGDCINKDNKLIQPAMEEAAKAASSAVAYVNSRKW